MISSSNRLIAPVQVAAQLDLSLHDREIEIDPVDAALEAVSLAGENNSALLNEDTIDGNAFGCAGACRRCAGPTDPLARQRNAQDWPNNGYFGDVNAAVQQVAERQIESNGVGLDALQVRALPIEKRNVADRDPRRGP